MMSISCSREATAFLASSTFCRYSSACSFAACSGLTSLPSLSFAEVEELVEFEAEVLVVELDLDLLAGGAATPAKSPLVVERFPPRGRFSLSYPSPFGAVPPFFSRAARAASPSETSCAHAKVVASSIAENTKSNRFMGRSVLLGPGVNGSITPSSCRSNMLIRGNGGLNAVFHRKRQGKHRSSPPALGRDRSAMLGHDALDQRQPQP